VFSKVDKRPRAILYAQMAAIEAIAIHGLIGIVL